MGRTAGRCAGFYNDFGYVEIILEKNLGGIYAGKNYYNLQFRIPCSESLLNPNLFPENNKLAKRRNSSDT